MPLIDRVFAALLLMVAAGGPALAQDQGTCKGRDLWSQTVPGAPAVDRQRIEALAATVVNGQAVLWRLVPRNGGPTSHLLGTMHVSDPRVTALSPAKLAAVDTAEVVAFENTRSIDRDAAVGAIAEVGPALFMANGRNLGDILDKGDLDRLRDALDRRGVPLFLVYGWKPAVLIFSMLGYPPCELMRQRDGSAFLDAFLYRLARANGKKTADLESLEQQFGAMSDVPEAAQVDILKSTLDLEPGLEDMFETTLGFYLKGRVDLLWAVTNVMASERLARADHLQALWATMLDRRNAVMFAKARALADAGPALIVAGAAHLIGPAGLVQRFKDAGYAVTPVE